MAQDTDVHRHKRGGIYFDDFVVGHLYEHPLTPHRHADGQHAVLQHDAEPAAAAHRPPFLRAETEWGQPLMNSLFTLGLMIGIMVNDLTVGTTIANLGMTEVKFPHPAVRGRHRSLHDRGHRQARIEVAARCRHRRVPSPRLQSGRQARGRMPPPGLHAHAAAADALTAFRPRRRRHKLDKALASGADAVILDLEDSVAAGGQGRGARARRPSSPKP